MDQFNVKDMSEQIIITNNTFLCWTVSGSAEMETASKVGASAQPAAPALPSEHDKKQPRNYHWSF